MPDRDPTLAALYDQSADAARRIAEAVQRVWYGGTPDPYDERSVWERAQALAAIQPSPTGSRIENLRQLMPYLLATGTGVGDPARVAPRTMADLVWMRYAKV